jgi:hypothetical protein
LAPHIREDVREDIREPIHPSGSFGRRDRGLVLGGEKTTKKESERMGTDRVRVVDIPEGIAADEVERRINAVDAEFYIASIVQATGTPGVAHRIFYKRRAKREDA